MKILILSHPKPDWMVDYFYQGAISLGHDVVFYPERKFYKIPASKLKADSLSILQPAKEMDWVSFISVWFDLYGGRFDLIIVSPLGYGKKKNILSSFSAFVKSLVRKQLSWRYIRLFPITAPLVVVDGVDESECNTDLIENASLKRYYKRELDGGLGAQFNNTVLPIRFGINVSRYEEFIQNTDDGVRYDICYIMSSSNHELRKSVKNMLCGLENKYNIFIHDSSDDGKISFIEYISIVKSSKITLSISGLGWDCLRHYEVPVVGSVLFVNEPTIVTGDFFENGKECVMFSNDLSDFNSIIEFYLSKDNREVLEEIRVNGMRAVRKRFDVTSTARYIIQSSLV